MNENPSTTNANLYIKNNVLSINPVTGDTTRREKSNANNEELNPINVKTDSIPPQVSTNPPLNIAQFQNNPNTQNNINPIMNNQTNPNSMTQQNNNVPVIIFDPNQLKQESVNTVCPYCKRQVTTNAIKRCDCVNCLCCLITGSCCFVPYCCFQCCRGKAISCYSASHYCPLCGGFLKEYLAC